jgi:hypothetical protein
VAGEAAVEEPDGDEVEDVEEGSGAGERGPDGVLSVGVDEVADGGGDPAGERAGERDLRDLADGDAEAGPADVGAEAGQEDGHFGGQAAAANVDVVAHLVDEDADAESHAEAPAEERDVEPDEDEKAEEEFELEQDERRRFEFEQEERQRTEGAEALDPVGRRGFGAGPAGLGGG